MDGGEQTTISPEFLENIQSAVNSQGVLGQVQVIETENGPVTVLFMEEGADTSNLGGESITLSVDGSGQGLSETVIQDENTQVQYQYHVQADDDYTQLLQGAVGDTIVSVADTVTSVKEDLAVEPVIDLPQVAPAVQSTVTETYQQPEGETSTDTYYITDTGEILKIDSSLLGENAGDTTLQLQTQDGTLQILNQIGNIQTTQVNTPLTTYTQPAVDNINITYEQSSPSFEFTATKVDSQGINEAPRAEEPKVLSYKTTNRQRSNIMRQPMSRPAPANIQPKPAVSSQTSLLQPQFSSLKQSGASVQTTEIIYPKTFQKQTTVFPKVQKQIVNTSVLKPGQQSYQIKAPPQKMITTVVKPQSLLKSNASNFMTSSSNINKPGGIQIPVTTKSFTQSTYTQKQVAMVNKIPSQVVSSGVSTVTKQQTDLLSVAMKQADVSHQILPSSVPEVKKFMTPTIIKQPDLSTPKTDTSADPVNKSISEELVSTKEKVEDSVPVSNFNTTVAEKTTNTEEQEMSPMDTGLDKPQEVNQTKSNMTSEESKMETDEQSSESQQPVDDKVIEDVTTGSKTDNTGADSSKQTGVSTEKDVEKPVEENVTPVKKSDEDKLMPSAANIGSNMKCIDVPDSDVTIQLFADGTLVTRDKAGTNYSQVKLEDLGLDLSMLEGNTDIELLIVQGDGKEVRATINTSKHVNPTTESLTSVSKGTSATTVASSTTGTKVTSSSSSSDRPTTTVSEARPYKCSMCPRTFKFYRTFRCHEIVHTKAVTFTCHLCQRLFAREVNLQSHLELHKKKGAMRPSEEQRKLANTNECKQCQKKFSSMHALQRHMKDQHEDHPRVPCPICGKLFKNETNVQRHSKIHVGPFTCPHCIKVFTDRTEYNEHIKSEHEDLMYPCKECNAVLPSKRAFVNHIKSQHQSADELMDGIKGNECTLCNKKFEKESELEAHLLVHSSTKSHECPACDRKYKLLNTLEKHIKEIHNNDVVFTCSDCDEKFEYKGKLDLHRKLFHTGSYKCLTCYEDFPDRTLLEEHQHKDHDFALVCSKCNDKFDSSLKLKNHLKDHTSQNNLCDICGAGFEHKAQLRSHLVNKHFGREKTTMLKKYPSMSNVNIEVVCDLCGEFWHNKPLYKQHLRDVHFWGDTVEMLKLFPTFEKIPDPPEPVTCDHCGKKCNSMVQLNFHLKTHVKSKRKSVQTEQFSSSDDDQEDPYDFTSIEPREIDKHYKCKKCGSQFARKAALEKHMTVHKKDEFKEALKNIEKEETARAELEELEGYKPTPREKKVGKASLKKITKQGKAGKIKLPFKKTKVESLHSSPGRRKSSKMHICKTCEEIFKTPEELTDHMHNDHGDVDFKVDMKNPSTNQELEFDLQTFHCKTCDKKFSSRKNLRKHLRGVHKYIQNTANSSELFKCTECEREFTMKSNMARHMMAKHDMKIDDDRDETPLKTRKKEEKTDEEFDDSNESMDEDSTTDITSFLGKNFNLGKTNSCNIQSVKKKQHRCSLCGEGFSRDATLKKHLALHEKEEDMSNKSDIDDMLDLQPAIYSCLSCGNKYSTALGLIHHTRSKHSEVDEETVLAQIAEVDAQLKLESPKKKLEKDVNKVNKKRKLEYDTEEDSENAKKRIKVDKQGNEVYNCKFCGMIYYTYKGVKKHENDVHSKGKLESPQTAKYSHSGRMITKSKKLSEQIHCDKCNKTFLEEKGLKQHLMRVHKEDGWKIKSAAEYGDFKCELCPKEFDQKINLRRHMKMKHNMELGSDTMNKSLSESPKANLVYNCDVCIQKFPTLSNLRSHMISAHDENDEEVKSDSKLCKICDKEFASEIALEVHMRKHTGEKPYKCCLCNKHFISKFKLECHIRKLHPKQWTKKVKCKICLMLFETQKAMLKHKLTHRKPQDSEEQKDGNSEQSQHKCSHCEKMFRWKRNLVSHIEVYHTESDPQTCGVCNKVFPDKESIKAHMTEHSKTKREIPTCKICDKTFRKQSSLKMHVAQLHKETPAPKGSMSCDICKESFATKMKLLEHMLSHTSVMPHKCDICSASFHMETKLKAHKLTHKLKEKKSDGKNVMDKGKKKSDEVSDSDKNKEPRYKCKKCSKKFRDMLLLKAHVTKAHKTKLVIKTSLPKDRITRSRSLSESKVDTSKPSLSKEKKPLKEKKVGKNEVKKAQSSFCKKCNLNFIKKETYEAHLKSVHDNKKIDQGKNAEKKIGSADKSKKITKSTAKKNNEDIKDLGMDCPICKKTFSKPFGLKSHIKNMHKVSMEDSPLENQRKKCLYCNQCARVFWSQKQYDTHNVKFHPDKNALELDKQVMQAMGDGDVKTELTDLVPKDADFETIQHKCEFCSMVHWTKKLFDEHMLSEHPEHAAEYGITGEGDTSSPTIELVNDSEDMMGNLLSVGLYDVSACNKLSSLPVVSIKRINGKHGDQASPSKTSKTKDAGESSSDAESDADEYTREYKKFLQNSVIDVSENTEGTETEDDNIIEQKTEEKLTDDKIEDSGRDEQVNNDGEENENVGKVMEGENNDDDISEKNNEDGVEMKINENGDNLEMRNNEDDDIKVKTNFDEVKKAEMEEVSNALHEVSNETTDTIMLEEDSSVSQQLQDESEQGVNQIDDEQISKDDTVLSNYVDEEKVGVNFDDESSDKGKQLKDTESKILSYENEKDERGESEIEQEQERIDWESIDNDIEAAVKEVDDENMVDQADEEEDDTDDENKGDNESGQEISTSNQELETEGEKDYEPGDCEAQNDLVESANTDNNAEKSEEENKYSDVQDVKSCVIENVGLQDDGHYTIENVDSSVKESGVSELRENKSDEMCESGENITTEESQSKDVIIEERRIHFDSQDALEEMDTS